MPSKYKLKKINHPIGEDIRYRYICPVCGHTQLANLPTKNRPKGYEIYRHCGQQMNFTLVDRREVWHKVEY